MGFYLINCHLVSILSLLIQWLIGNQAAQLGGVVIFPVVEVWWQRLFIGGLLLFSGFSLYRARKVATDNENLNFVWTIIFIITLMTVFSITLNNDPWLLLWIPLGFILFGVVWISLDSLLARWTNLSEDSVGILAFVLAGAIAEAIAVAVAGAVAGARAVAVAVAVAVAGAVVGAVALAVAGALALALALALAGAGAGALALVLIIALVININESWLSNHRPMRLALFNGLLFLLLGFATIFSTELNASSRALFVFLGFLPIINAFFDYLSIGLTRYLLQRSLRSRFPALLGFVDAVGAALFFLLLKASLLTLFILLQDANGEPLLPLLGEQGLLQQIAHQPHDFYWLYFILFSTLIPTILHLNLACFSLAVTSFAGLRSWLNDLAKHLQQPDQDWMKIVSAFLRLVLFSTVIIVVPLWAFSHLWQLFVFLIWGEPDVLKQLLSWAESYAEWVAAFRE